jgi:hypothetical protein
LKVRHATNLPGKRRCRSRTGYRGAAATVNHPAILTVQSARIGRQTILSARSSPRGTRHPRSMTNESVWRCSKLCTTVERGADGVRRGRRHDRCIPSGLSRYQPFCVGVLPRLAGRRRAVSNADRPNPADQDLAIGSISIPDQVTRDLLPATGFSELIGDPFSRWVRSHAKPQDLPSVMAHAQNE